MRRFRVDSKGDKIVKLRVIKRVAAYKYIPRHANSRTLKKRFVLYIILKGHECLLCKCLLLNVYRPTELHEFVNDYGFAQN